MIPLKDCFIPEEREGEEERRRERKQSLSEVRLI
jgi:hypothetical protein